MDRGRPGTELHVLSDANQPAWSWPPLRQASTTSRDCDPVTAGLREVRPAPRRYFNPRRLQADKVDDIPDLSK